jgi:hypothetical protein
MPAHNVSDMISQEPGSTGNCYLHKSPLAYFRFWILD